MDTSGRISAVSEDRMATDLLRLARDPITGRIKHRTGVDVCLRAALFADLALRGQIINRRGSPAVALPELTGDRMLAAMCGATTGGLPRPVSVKQDLAPLFTTFAEDTIPKIIDAAATSMRRARRGGSGLARPAGGVLNWMPRRRAS